MSLPSFAPLEQQTYTPTPHPFTVKGVAPDRPRESLGNDLLSTALNFLVRGGRVHKREGYSTIIGTASNLSSSLQGGFEWIPYDSSPRMVLATTTKFYALSGSQTGFDDVTTTARTGTLDNPIFFRAMRTASSGLRLISVNGVDPPAWWSGDTSSAFTYMTTAVFGTCAAVWKSHFLQGDTTDTADGHISTRVHWSALGDPTTWSGTASAGSIDLIDENASRVMVFHPLRRVLVAYKEEAAHALIYKASPLYFTQVTLHASLSLMAARLVTPVENGDIHCLFTKEGVVLWDGQSVKPIGRNRVDKTLLAALNWSKRRRSFMLWWPHTQEILIGIPTGSSDTVDRVWVYNMEYDSWWETDMPLNYVVPSTLTFSTPRALCTASDSTSVIQLWTGKNDATSSGGIAASIETGLFDYGSIVRKGLHKAAVLVGPATGTQAVIGVSVGGTENPAIPPTFGTAQSITVTTAATQPHVDIRFSDRWISYRVTHTASSETCELVGIVPHIGQLTDFPRRR